MLPKNILPAPRASIQGDFVFVSTLYPVDSDGRVIQSDSISPFFGESLVAAQTRALCEGLAAILEQNGSVLGLTVKAEVYLVDPVDFYEFKMVWHEVFSVDPPARTTAVVGDEHLMPGVRLTLTAIALVSAAADKRETITIEEVPNPMDAEWCPQAMKAAPFVFPSGVTATDFETGIAVKTNPVVPFYGSDAEMQTRYIFDNWAKVLEAAGSDLTQALKSQAFEVDLYQFHDMDRVWGEYLGHQAGTFPPTRSSMAVRNLLVPGALLIANLIFLVPDEKHRKSESRKGIRWHPEDVRAVHFTPGIEAGSWFFMAGQLACPDYENLLFTQAPKGLPYHYSDIEVQTEGTMELLNEQLLGNGLSLKNVVDARVFLVESRRDFRGFARAWHRIWKDVGSMPSMNFIPSNQQRGGGGAMIPELLIEIDLIAHRGHGD